MQNVVFLIATKNAHATIFTVDKQNIIIHSFLLKMPDPFSTHVFTQDYISIRNDCIYL